MTPNCPHCRAKNNSSEVRTRTVRYGFFKRKSDCRRVQRFKCMECLGHFSKATDHSCVWQKKRQFNHQLGEAYCSGMSQRRLAKYLNLNRKTIVRKFIFLGHEAETKLAETNLKHEPVTSMQFDDLETFEHSKHKPLSVTLAVGPKQRILGFEVSQMAARGTMAKKAVKKYGKRKDMRSLGRKNLFKKIQPLVHPKATIKSDQNPYYVKDVKHFFPQATHTTFKGQRGSLGGQGELKKTGFDPIFDINHTFAMLRANINRLFRKTWCTTKLQERLRLHIAMYAVYHNLELKNSS